MNAFDATAPAIVPIAYGKIASGFVKVTVTSSGPVA